MKVDKEKFRRYKKVYITLAAILLAIIIGVGVYFFLNAEDAETRLTLLERQWIENNKDTLIDFKVPSNLSVLSSENGVFIDLIDNLEKDTSLSINRAPYTYPATYTDNTQGIYVLKNTDASLSSDVFMMEDSYVLVGTTRGYVTLESSIYGKNVGVLDSDKDYIGAYFNKNVNITGFSTLTALYDALTSGTINYIVVPRYYVLNDVISNDALFINYSFDNLSNKIVLRLGSEDKLNDILSKYVSNYVNNSLRKSLEKSMMDSYESSLKITDIQKDSLTSKVFKYGFINDGVYNSASLNKLSGIAGEYINAVSSMSSASFEYKSYGNKDDLLKALSDNSIDVAFMPFDTELDSYNNTVSGFKTRMMVLAPTYQATGDFNSRVLFAKENSYLYSYLTNNYKASVTPFSNIPNNISSGSLLVLDTNDYRYYDLKNDNYVVVATDEYANNYRFMVNKDNEVLYSVLNYLLEDGDGNYYNAVSMNNLASSVNSNRNFMWIYILVIIVIGVPLVFVIVSFILRKFNKQKASSKKVDVLKYNDMLTSLKNRNYLNANINDWDESKVFPRTIIIVDLNNLKYVNDNYGHEEGNELIRKAAAILINTQLEKSEIVRTDGNEFLIYMIGYTKGQVNTYISKLAKEFESLPHGFGAAIGYSMIEDEIKTIDDAINEATIEMRIDKEQNYR